MSHVDDDDNNNNDNCKVVRVHAMKPYIGVVLLLLSFLALAVSGVSTLLASPPAALCLGKSPLCLASRR